MGTLGDGYFVDGAYWIVDILSYGHIGGWIFWGWGILDCGYFELWAYWVWIHGVVDILSHHLFGVVACHKSVLDQYPCNFSFMETG